MRTAPSLTHVEGPEILASRRGFLTGFGAAPAAVFTREVGLIGPQFDTDDGSVELQRTRDGRQLSRSRYHNAEGFFRSARKRVEGLDADRLYSFGIVIQLGLSAHLLDVGFADNWCARQLGLHVSRSLACANATGLGLDSGEFGLLAALLSPYGKWRHARRTLALDFPFTDGEATSLVRQLLDQVHDVTGHPRPRGWRNQSS
jgi:hypothetical protein